jgi:transitional endoplasmic reticulum ATPase
VPRTNNGSIKLEQISEAIADLEQKVLVKKTDREQQIEDALEQLARVGGKLTAEEDILFQGTKLVLPETMELREAIRFLNEKMEEDQRTMTFDRVFKYRPWDGAHATMAVLKRTFGAVTQRATRSFFGDVPPALKTINVGPDETAQVPWGRMGIVHLPGLDVYLDSVEDEEFGIVFHVMAQGPRKYRHHVEGIFSLIEKELASNSIYRGKAFDGQKMPQFLDLSGVDGDKVIYSDLTMEQLDANIWSVLRWPDVLEELGMPLKRAVLLEGPYGTGKTLAAYLTAKIAVENGWSFLLCRPGQDNLMEVMSTARLYQPAVVFFEDVDAIAGGENNIPRLLDIFDGIKAKGTRIMCVLTTNHVERIHKGMVRPGRLDAVIHIGALDASGLRRLVEAVVPYDLLDVAIDWEAVCGAMEGFLPAFARESIDRAIRYNVARNQGKATELATADFVAAALGLRPQLELMQGAKDTQDKNALDDALSKVIIDAAADAVDVKLDKAHLVDNDGDTIFQLFTN